MARVHSQQVAPSEVNRALQSFSKLGWVFVSQSTVTSGSAGMMVENPFADGMFMGASRSATTVLLFFSHENDDALTPSEHAVNVNRQQMLQQKKALADLEQAKLEEERLQELRRLDLEAEQLRIASELRREREEKSLRDEAERQIAVRNTEEDRKKTLGTKALKNLDSLGYRAWLLGLINIESGFIEISDDNFPWCTNCKASQSSEEPCPDCWRDNENFFRYEFPSTKGTYAGFRIVKEGEPLIGVGGMILLDSERSKKLCDAVNDHGSSQLLSVVDDFEMADGLLEYVGTVQSYLDDETEYIPSDYRFKVGDANADESGWFAKFNLFCPAGEYSVIHFKEMSLLLVINVDELSALGLSKDIAQGNGNVTWDPKVTKRKFSIDTNNFKKAIGSNIELSYATAGNAETPYELAQEYFEYYSWLTQYEHVQPNNLEIRGALLRLLELFDEEQIPSVKDDFAYHRGFIKRALS
jgi:hypothetical protein